MSYIPTYTQCYLSEVAEVLGGIETEPIEKMAMLLEEVRKASGRLFIIGNGGSAANASHAVNDFRKVCGFDAQTPTDNVAELTARINDDSWDTAFTEWLRASNLCSLDCVFVLSVGGGSVGEHISVNIVNALQYAKRMGATVVGIVGRDGGCAGTIGDACVIVPTVNPATTTGHTESFQAVIWHLLVSHPLLKRP